MAKRRRTSSRLSKSLTSDDIKDEEIETGPEATAPVEDPVEEEDEVDQPRVKRQASADQEDAEPPADAQDDDVDDEEVDEDDVDEDDEEDEDIALTPSRGRRGRPPGSKNKATLARELSAKPQRGRRSGTVSRRSTEEPSDNEDAGEAGADTPTAGTPARRGRRGRLPTRGRGRGGGTSAGSTGPLDHAGLPQKVENDEIVLPEDPEGEKKVTADGELLGDREYRVRTFTVTGRGTRLYMLSTEPARCMGFRDSYLLFQKHKRLYKIIVNEDEKYDLIEREIIPHSYKGRAIGIVTARSVFREFGARIIVGGKKITDDYYEQEAIEQGFVPGQVADPEDRLPPPGVPYNKNQYVAWHGASAVYHQYTQPQPSSREVYKESYTKRKKIVVTDENWMLEHANAASTYNHEIMERRKLAWTPQGVYEPHTGVRFFPANTQPQTAQLVHLSKSVKHEDGSNPRIVVDTVMDFPVRRAKATGLKDVPAEVFASAAPEIREAILRQQALERQLV